jgi:hypothetical protein
MYELRRAAGVTAGMILMGVIGIQGPAHATSIELCDFTVTSAGNGAQVLFADFTPDMTLQTGQVFGLINNRMTRNNILYWEGTAPLHTPTTWYPIKAVDTGVKYMAEDTDSCSSIDR